MGANCAIPAGGEFYRSSSKTWLADDLERHVLCGEEWLCLARLASRLSLLEDDLPLLSSLSQDGSVGTTQPRHPRSSARESRTRPPGQCDDRRQPIGQKCRRW